MKAAPETIKSNWPPLSRPVDLKTEEEWNGFKRGDPCKIEGDRTADYTFHLHTVYANGNEGVVLYGGTGNHRQYREVGTDVVVRTTGKNRRPDIPIAAPVQPAGTVGQQMPGVPERHAQASQPIPAGNPAVGDLKAAREALGLSRRVVAERAGISQAALDKLERGQSTRNPDAEAKVRAALGAA